MAKKLSVLENLKANPSFHGFLRGDIFVKYPKVTASDAVEAFKQGREQVFARASLNSDEQRAKDLETLLNQAAQDADFDKQVEGMATRILQRMEAEAQKGLQAGANSVTGSSTQDYGLTSTGGLSYTNISSAAKQALSVYESGLAAGKQYTQIAGAKGGGTYENYKKNSAYDFLNQLNKGTITAQQIRDMANGYKYLSNMTGELLERVLETVGSACYAAGAEVGSLAVSDVLNSLGTQSVTQKTLGAQERHVSLSLDKKQGAIVFDSQGKVDVKIPFPDGTEMAISAKSLGRMSQQVHLVTDANLMGLIAGSGIASSKFGYSALTVYTGGATYSEQSSNATFMLFKKMLAMQALSGTTDQKDDLANYMVFQVGNTDKPHFRVVSMRYFINEDNLSNNISQFIQLKFNPNPLPMGANTYIENNPNQQVTKLNTGKIRYPRSEATLEALFSAQVSVTLKSGFLNQLYGSFKDH